MGALVDVFFDFPNGLGNGSVAPLFFQALETGQRPIGQKAQLVLDGLNILLFLDLQRFNVRGLLVLLQKPLDDLPGQCGNSKNFQASAPMASIAARIALALMIVSPSTYIPIPPSFPVASFGPLLSLPQ